MATDPSADDCLEFKYPLAEHELLTAEIQVKQALRDIAFDAPAVRDVERYADRYSQPAPLETIRSTLLPEFMSSELLQEALPQELLGKTRGTGHQTSIDSVPPLVTTNTDLLNEVLGDDIHMPSSEEAGDVGDQDLTEHGAYQFSNEEFNEESAEFVNEESNECGSEDANVF